MSGNPNAYGSSPSERFWAKVDKSGDCWVWTGARQPNGYGRLTVDQKGWLAHRFSFYLAFGTVAVGQVIAHRCDNPPCVRPDHLFAADHLTNMADMRAKGRSKSGAARWNAMPSDAVDRIRKLAAEGLTSPQIAERVGVSARGVRHVIQGTRWAA